MRATWPPSSRIALPASGKTTEIKRILESVPDPEIPAVSVVDLGIVREVRADLVVITPTYTGCPATLAIEQSIRVVLDAHGFGDVAIETVLSPPWSTDWISGCGAREAARFWHYRRPKALARQS